MKMIQVEKGRYAVSTDSNALLVAENLGATLCVCALDETAGVFGAGVFFLPGPQEAGPEDEALDCVSGLKNLISDLIKAGAAKSGLKIWIIGAAQFMECPNTINLGAQLFSVASRMLKKNGFRITGQHIGGPFSRTVRFPVAGRPVVMSPGSEKEITV